MKSFTLVSPKGDRIVGALITLPAMALVNTFKEANGEVNVEEYGDDTEIFWEYQTLDTSAGELQVVDEYGRTWLARECQRV